MSTVKKVLIAVFSIILIAALAFIVIWGIVNYEKVKEGFSGTGLYTKEDLDNAYEDGYNNALEEKDELLELIAKYEEVINTQVETINQLTTEKNELNKVIAERQQDVDDLLRLKSVLQEQVNSLQKTIDGKDGTIGEMTAEKQAMLETVDRLNFEIAQLNEQIDGLNQKINSHLTTVQELNQTIAELQKTIAYYEEYVAQFQTSDQAIVTFEFDGSVYDVKTVKKGEKVTVTDPPSTQYVIFNGWMLDGEPLDLSTYTVTGNVRIIADVTYKYIVSFSVDGVVKSTQVVEKGGYATEPSKPKKNGYTFKYWTLDGETEVVFDQYPIFQNTTFVAKFAELYTVNFISEGQTLATRRIERGHTTSPLAVESTDEKVFNGWMVDGQIVDVAKYAIYEDTDFVASFTYTNASPTSQVVQDTELVSVTDTLAVNAFVLDKFKGVSALAWVNPKIRGCVNE